MRFESEEEELQAARLARIAARAEERSAAKASDGGRGGLGGDLGVVFRSKKERLEDEREEEAEKKRKRGGSTSHEYEIDGGWKDGPGKSKRASGIGFTFGRDGQGSGSIRDRDERIRDVAKECELEEIRKQYLGGGKKVRKLIKPSEKFKQVFQFEWDASDDTSKDSNPLYSERSNINALYGRGYIAGIDMREQRKGSAFMEALMRLRHEEQRRQEAVLGLGKEGMREREEKRRKELQNSIAAAKAAMEGALPDESIPKAGSHWSEKSLLEMKERDWRIFKEDFDIHVKGGKAPLPLRNWEEGNLPDGVLRSIDELGYKEPSPIQRQGIPVGLEFRDMIGIAETGSGKTAAFCIPMISYILSLPSDRRKCIASEGPLACIMAPTRELALQIHEECLKFAKYTGLKMACIVGGQDIEVQGFLLGQGVHIVIGTPGRLNDCLEKHLLVLNQASYVVLDEADRMIDMGFEEQVLAVLEGMGGLLKSEDEETALKQEQDVMKHPGKSLFRVTSMFSATMPPEVERMAQKYLRHPAIVQIGDQDSGKNRRIEQRVVMCTESGKKNELLGYLRRYKDTRGIVFVNTKKTSDILGRSLEQQGYDVGILHGGKTQEQREANLEDFRNGNVNILVATDVASRGLDIPDVGYVFNYEMPLKIETYSHRIGRTGRAGKEGLAITFITDTDEDVLYDLKQYLISTESHVPSQLDKHPAAQAPVGTRKENGELVSEKRSKIMYSKK